MIMSTNRLMTTAPVPGMTISPRMITVTTARMSMADAAVTIMLWQLTPMPDVPTIMRMTTAMITGTTTPMQKAAAAGMSTPKPRRLTFHPLAKLPTPAPSTAS